MSKKRWDFDFIRHPKQMQELRKNQNKNEFSRGKRRFKTLDNYLDKYIKRIKSWKCTGRKNQYKIKP